MNDVDLALRRLIYAHFGRTGRALSRVELAAALEKQLDWVDERLASLSEQRMVVLGADAEIARALPFCAAPTPFIVRAGGVTYHGNCAWDAFGLAALMGPSAEIELTCGDCGETIELGAAGALVHFGVPAAAWWDDIDFTCSSIAGFRSEAHLERWLAARGRSPGAVVAMEAMQSLGAAWFGGYLDADWRPRSIAESQAILSSVGLTGKFWQILAVVG